VNPPGLAFLSPSQFNIYRQCPRRLSYDRRARADRPRRARPAAELGTVAHLCLESLVKAGTLWSPDVAGAIERAWEEAARATLGDAAGSTAGHDLVRARLPNAVTALLELVPRPEGVLAEQWVASRDGLLQGKVDLLCERPGGWLLVDYKSTLSRDLDTGELHVDDYERQLQLYAHIVADSTGVPVSRAVLLPLDGGAVEVNVEAGHVAAVAGEARAALAAFNAAGPADPPAAPAEDTCRFCDHHARCPEFWLSCDSTWAGLSAAAGTIVAVQVVAAGGVSFSVDVVAGSVPAGRIAVTRVPRDNLPPLDKLQPESWVAITGLHARPGGGAYRLPDWGRVDPVGDPTALGLALT
jgi:putative RecB family exonuclease